jgi:hypothetical protein
MSNEYFFSKPYCVKHFNEYRANNAKIDFQAKLSDLAKKQYDNMSVE